MAFLTEKGFDYELSKDARSILLLLKNFGLPEAYNPREVTLLLRIPFGYPGGKPDMFWTHPHVTLVNGSVPKACAVYQNILGESWQRWSRHWKHDWRPGVDGLATFIAAIKTELSAGR